MHNKVSKDKLTLQFHGNPREQQGGVAKDEDQEADREESLCSVIALLSSSPQLSKEFVLQGTACVMLVSDGICSQATLLAYDFPPHVFTNNVSVT